MQEKENCISMIGTVTNVYVVVKHWVLAHYKMPIKNGLHNQTQKRLYVNDVKR